MGQLLLSKYSIGISEEKEIKGIQIGKEDVKLSLFSGDTILSRQNMKESTDTHTHTHLLELMNEFSRFIGYNLFL